MPRPRRNQTEELIRLAKSGAPKALKCLRSLIDELPAVGRVLTERAGSIAALPRAALVQYAPGGGAALSAELMRRELDELRAGRAGPERTPLERIPAERVALGWFDVDACDRRFVAHADRFDACRALAASRKPGLPAIPFNAARRQVNVAGGAMGAWGER